MARRSNGKTSSGHRQPIMNGRRSNPPRAATLNSSSSSIRRRPRQLAQRHAVEQKTLQDTQQKKPEAKHEEPHAGKGL